MASFFTFNNLQQKHHLSITLCKSPSPPSPPSLSLNTLSLLSLSHFLTFSPPKHTPFYVLKSHCNNIQAKLSTKNDTHIIKTTDLRVRKGNVSGFSSLTTGGERSERQSLKKVISSLVDEKIDNRYTKGKNARKKLDYEKGRDFGPGNMSTRNNKERKSLEIMDNRMEKKPRKGSDNKVKEEKRAKGSKSNKADPQEVNFRTELDKCCKRGDVMAAIQLYDLGQREGIKMGQYHYTVLLYLCSSAAAGVVQPAKSGRGGRASNSLEVSNEVSKANVVEFSKIRDNVDRNVDCTESDSQISNNVKKLVDTSKNPGSKDKMELSSRSRSDDLDKTSDKKNLHQISIVVSEPNYQQLDHLTFPVKNKGDDGNEILVSEDIKKYALERGFEMYKKMCMDKVPMNEATLTAVARIAMSMGNGDMAFDMVKQMKLLGLNPRLRSYGPALATFCNNGDVDKAFTVEKHMLEHGVYPEEPELEALLRVSVKAGKGDKVYYLLHKLRSGVRKVSPSTANIIVGWFKSKAASRVGKVKWDKRVVKEAIESGGGGWHGQGWLGKGKWTVTCSSVGADACCKSCGEKLATIDLDPAETQNFAESVASIAIKREKFSSFQKFQKWLDYYGPFEAVIDGANVGLLSQKRFVPSKINAIANGIRQKLPSKKWPLIVLHSRRVTGHKMDDPVNKSLVDKWKNADALYATPTGSNDDWYWLYAAIKFRCLIVTNDEMRDHTFQLLGNDFFPKWKEMHQVHFGFSDTGPVFHMPPSFSVVIQESEKGHWHIPIASNNDYETERAWLCITRAKTPLPRKNSITTTPEDSQSVDQSKKQARSTTKARVKAKEDTLNPVSNEDNSPQKVYKNLRNILSASGFTDHLTVVSEIEAAEKLGDCVIDFQI